MKSIKGIVTRERCHLCNKINSVGFWVPNKVWKAVVPKNLQESVLCIACFTDFADERLIEWDEEIAFFPVSLINHLRFIEVIDK